MLLFRAFQRGLIRTIGVVPLAAGILPVALTCSEVRAQAPEEGRTVQGVVRSLTTAPMGEVDGAVLDDGTTLHWPPHLATRFSSIAARGERVKAVGSTETGPAGDTNFEVSVDHQSPDQRLVLERRAGRASTSA